MPRPSKAFAGFLWSIENTDAQLNQLRINWNSYAKLCTYIISVRVSDSSNNSESWSVRLCHASQVRPYKQRPLQQKPHRYIVAAFFPLWSIKLLVSISNAQLISQYLRALERPPLSFVTVLLRLRILIRFHSIVFISTSLSLTSFIITSSKLHHYYGL